MGILYNFLFAVISSLLITGDPGNNIPINHIQVIGSHNSYKKAIDPNLFNFLQKLDSVRMSKIDYSHISLTEQLDLGLLNLEIDVYADVKGGKYAHPKGLDFVSNQAPYDTAGIMKEPGFKVFHIQDIDFRSNCFTFRQCLQELKKWSDLHPNHNPIFITMNAKDEIVDRPGFTVPEKFISEIFDDLDNEIVKYIGKNYVITPDQIRGKYATLENAVLQNHWPDLKNAKGKFIFILDEQGDKQAEYVKGHPSLRNRLLFVNADPGKAEAAILIMNDAKKDSAAIKKFVKMGYIVRTRADSDTKEARENDKSSFVAALQSGAQIITTDYYQKSQHFKSDYVISFEGNKYIRSNPVFANK